MKIWVFICGVLVCSLLFFASGTLVGYSVCEKRIVQDKMEKKSPKRKPSTIEKVINPIVGSYAPSKMSALRSKVRIPSNPAIDKARQYSSVVNQANQQ